MDTVTYRGRVFRLPFQDLFRDLHPPERAGLSDSIREHGVHHPALVYDSPTWGKDCVIDGANGVRLAAEHDQHLPVTPVLDLTDEQAEALARTLNTNRRHLTPEEQRAARAARVERVAAARADGESLRAIAGKEKISESQVRKDIQIAGAHLTARRSEVGTESPTLPSRRSPANRRPAGGRRHPPRRRTPGAFPSSHTRPTPSLRSPNSRSC